MGQRTLYGEEATVSYNANGTETEKLNRQDLIRYLEVRLNGQLTISSTDNTSGNTARGDEWSLINSIDIVANGKQVLKSYDPNLLWWQNYYLFGAVPKISPELGDGTANPNYDCTLIIPFWKPDAVRPFEYTLDPRQFSNLQIRIDWTDETAVNSNASGHETDPSLRVSAQRAEYKEGSSEFNYSLFKEYTVEGTITSDNPNLVEELPVNGMLSGLLMEFTDGDADDGTVLNNFTVESGGTTYATYKDPELGDARRLLEGLPRSHDGTAYDDLRMGDDNDVDGVYHWTPNDDGMSTELIDAPAEELTQLDLNMDVTNGSNTTKYRVLVQQVFPVRDQNGRPVFSRKKNTGNGETQSE